MKTYGNVGAWSLIGGIVLVVVVPWGPCGPGGGIAGLLGMLALPVGGVLTLIAVIERLTTPRAEKI